VAVVGAGVVVVVSPDVDGELDPVPVGEVLRVEGVVVDVLVRLVVVDVGASDVDTGAGADAGAGVVTVDTFPAGVPAVVPVDTGGT
jgi:hypothetical protein